MKMRKIITMVVIATFILGIGAISGRQTIASAAPANAGATIGYVDMPQVLSNSKEYKDAQTTLAAEADALQKEFDSKSTGLSEDEKKQLFGQYQQRLGLKRQELFTKVKDKLDAAIKDVATAQGITVVLEKESVLYGGKDLTQDVVNKIK